MKKLSTLQNLEGRVALVAGGAGYLGRQISETLAELGADVVIASRDPEKCQVCGREIEAAFPGTESMGTCLDLTDRASIADCVRTTEAWKGRIDILVICAWSGKKNSLESITDDDWDYDIEVCLNGVFRLVKAGLEPLKRTKGVVLTIGSMYGHVAPDFKLYEGVPQVNPPSYGAAKAGVIQLTRYLASFLAPHGIRANCLSPGPFPFPEVLDEFPVFRDRLNQKNPMGRVGLPHEIKGAAALLCTDASSYMTGQNICVDGGWTAW